MDSIDRLSREAIAAIAAAIRESEGQEVCCACELGEEGIVASVVVTARGNEEAVPALMPHLEKGDVVVHNHPSGRLRPSDADLTVASHLGNLGIGFYIVDNLVDRLYVVSEPVLLRERVLLAPDRLRSILAPGGALSRESEDYEEREAQLEMVDAVSQSFNEDSICVAEAGTGVGKSLAYLLPAMQWVDQNDERVVISTATINLQQQLVETDLPLVQRLLGTDIPVALVKGRSNYLCLRKLDEALREEALFREEDQELEAIRAWAATTTDGSKADLAAPTPDGLWARVASEADSCVGLRCQFRERCFVLQARRRAAAARLLVVNHHLLFSDLSMRLSGVGFENTAVLPPFQRIVFDEAHNIEASATSYFSESLNVAGLARQLGRLHRRRKGNVLGLVPRLARLANVKDLIEGFEQVVRETESRATSLNDLALSLHAEQQTLRYQAPPSEEVVRRVLLPMAALKVSLADLLNRVTELMNGLDDSQLDAPEAYETRIVCTRLGGYAALCDRFCRLAEEQGTVFWSSRYRPKSGDAIVDFIATPLDVAPLLREAVFDRYASVVLTSATLSLNGDFSFWLSRVGLEGFEGRHVRSLLLPSPFPYREQVLLGVPTDAPPPESPLFGEFAARFIEELLSCSEGSGLVLFTSYAMLEQTYQSVQPALAARNIAVLKQGSDDRGRLLRRFKEDVSSVLFATDSFWEGVDAPGDTLRVVIICRLPFKVPTDPVVLARTEAIDREGGNSFGRYSLPIAVMRLKQGFGRLMRKQSDRGVVVILDPRVVTKAYGRLFIDSLPETARSFKPGAQLLRDVERFLFS